MMTRETLVSIAVPGVLAALAACSSPAGEERILTVSSSVPAREEAPAAGDLLVAARDLRDPNFEKTVVLLLRAGRQASASQAAATGATYGVLVFLNPAPLAILPAVLWFLAPRQGLRRILLRLGTFLGAALVVCLPWLVRNQVVLGTFALRPNLGVELCVGNNDLADGRFVLAYHPSSSPRFEHYQQVGEAEYGREALDEALTWISAHPGDFVKLSLYRAMVFWLGELPTHDSRRSGELVASQDPKAWIKWLTNLVTGSLALIAIVAFCRRSADRLLLVGVVGLFPLVYYVTHVSERYRFPMEPLLVFLDVWLILVVLDRWRRS